MRQLGTLKLRQESRPKLREPVERHVRLHRHSVARHAPLILPLLRGKTAKVSKERMAAQHNLSENDCCDSLEADLTLISFLIRPISRIATARCPRKY
jgi:hypothetical protein